MAVDCENHMDILVFESASRWSLVSIKVHIILTCATKKACAVCKSHEIHPYFSRTQLALSVGT